MGDVRTMLVVGCFQTEDGGLRLCLGERPVLGWFMEGEKRGRYNFGLRSRHDMRT